MTDANGLLYMRARYYNPYICRFINPDPSGFAGGLNWYCYANGNPINCLDPFGLCPTSAGPAPSWFDNAYDACEGAFGDAAELAAQQFKQQITVAATVAGKVLGAVVNPQFSNGGNEPTSAALPLLLLLGTGGESAALEAGAAEATLPSDIAATFSGGNYTSTVLQQEMTAYRYSGGISQQPAGQFSNDR